MTRVILSVISCFSIILTLSYQSFGQTEHRQYLGYKDTGTQIELKVSDGSYLFLPYNNQIIKTTFYPMNQEVKDFSYAISMKPEKVEYSIKETEESLKIMTSGIQVFINKKPFNVSYYYHDSLLISENKGYVEDSIFHAMNFSIQSDEILYGGGARVLGMNRRGYKLELYNKAHYGYTTHSELMNYTIPMFLSSHQYAVLFDNASKGFLDLDSQKNNTVNYETVSGTMNYSVIAGDNWYNLINEYTQLTGRQPLPPRWAFGNFTSRFGYHSQKEVLETVDLYFKDSIPVEAAIIDIYWFSKGIFNEMGRLDWYRDSFPNPGSMIQTLSKRGVKTILVTEPFILTTSDRWKEAVDDKILGTDSVGNPFTYNFYFGNTGLIDVFKPEAQTWFWNIYKNLTNQGIGGWWGDLGEPEVHPSALHHVNGTADEIHNAYGHKWLQLVYEGYQTDFPNIRPFILMRAGYAGSQRYGMIPWSGDVSRSWGGLVSQPEIALEMGMQGIAYMHSDLGGFAGGDSLDNELYTRWLQYGIFQPVYRPHAQEQIPAEPVFQKPQTKAYAKASIEMRYKLMPYIYTMAFNNSRTGKPLMHPLFFDEPENKYLLTYDSAYMWGGSFLVSPIKSAGVKNQTVYLPKGQQWIDFYNESSYMGGQFITIAVKMDHIPVFVKGGSFIPMLNHIANTTEADFNNLELHYYNDDQIAASDYQLYSDDGKTPDAFEKNNFELIKFAALKEARKLSIGIQKEPGAAYQESDSLKIKFVIHHLTMKPKQVSFGNRKINSNQWTWDQVLHIFTFDAGLVENRENLILIFKNN